MMCPKRIYFYTLDTKKLVLGKLILLKLCPKASVYIVVGKGNIGVHFSRRLKEFIPAKKYYSKFRSISDTLVLLWMDYYYPRSIFELIKDYLKEMIGWQ